MYNPANDPRITDAVREDRSVLVTAATERDQWRNQAIAYVNDIKAMRATCEELDKRLSTSRLELVEALMERDELRAEVEQQTRLRNEARAERDDEQAWHLRYFLALKKVQAERDELRAEVERLRAAMGDGDRVSAGLLVEGRRAASPTITPRED